MSRSPLLATLVATSALLLLPAFAVPAAASPCATPCGDVQVAFDCAAWSVTAEGAGGGLGTVWTFVVTEWVHAFSHATSQAATGPAAFFQASGLSGFPGYGVRATLYADGEVVDSETRWCG